MLNLRLLNGEHRNLMSRKPISPFIKKVLIILAVCIIVFVPVVSVCQIRAEARHALAETKNAEFALRLLAMEYYGKNDRIYDMLQPDGLTVGAAEQIRDLSGIEGDLVLGSWDEVRNAPRYLIYTKEKFVVIYEYEEQTGAHWKLHYQFQDVAASE